MPETPEMGPTPRVVKSPAELAEEARITDVSLAPKFKGKSPNEMADTIPDSLPGAASVEKMIVPGAKHTLVHIRQVHEAPGEIMLRKTIERSRSDNDVLLRTVQTDIHLILLKLKQGSGLQRIYQEGRRDSYRTLPPERTRENKSSLKQLRNVEAELISKLEDLRKTEASADGDSDKIQKAAIQKERLNCELLLADTRQRIDEVDERITQHHAAGEFGYTYGIPLVPAETEKAHAQALKMNKEMYAPAGTPDENAKNPPKRPTQAEYDAAVMLGRENALLEIVSKKNDPFAVTVYGGAHNWKGSVETWNTNHPDDKFSLVTITPKSYTVRGEKRE